MANQELKTLFDILRKKAVLILKFAQLIEYEKSTSLLNKENVHQKLAPDLFLILINSPKKSINTSKKLFSKQDILRDDYQKTFK